MSVEKWQAGSALFISFSSELQGLCVSLFPRRQVSLMSGYIHSGTRLPDFASDSPADFGELTNLSEPQFPNVICKMGF